MFENLEYNEDELKKLNIHELRQLARNVGVFSPTTLSKTQLISQILSIIYGDEASIDNQSAAGRPSKDKFKESQLLFSNDTTKTRIMKKNPFVKDFEKEEDELPIEQDNQFNDDYYENKFFNPYRNQKVASSAIEYKNENSKKKDKSITKIKAGVISPELLECGKKIRKLLGRENEEIVIEPEEEIDVEGLTFVSGFVFRGVQDKLYFACPDDVSIEQSIYLIPEHLCKLYAIHVGDFVEAWVDSFCMVVQVLSSINGLSAI